MMWCDDLHGVGETDRSCCDWLTLETLILGTYRSIDLPVVLVVTLIMYLLGH